jgi:hypothetical protein
MFGTDHATNVTYGMLYNGWGIDIILQVSRDNVNPAEKG